MADWKAFYVDWSRAPEGTTHVRYVNDIFIRGLPGDLSRWEKHSPNPGAKDGGYKIKIEKWNPASKSWDSYDYADKTPRGRIPMFL